ncbi:pro-neuregulin-4 [Huso huso]|uniref:Pro-neuregulin-4 n=1 Tax=Huso huso TaxID=61971 RepID=A0ABR0YXE4_HUSHU
MMAAHGEPCEALEQSYCYNGGRCYRIPSMSTLSCVCTENYRGARCEEFQLLSKANSRNEAGLIVGSVILSILIALVLAGVIYCICRIWRQKQRNQQNSKQQYSHVYPQSNRI